MLSIQTAPFASLNTISTTFDDRGATPHCLRIYPSLRLNSANYPTATHSSISDRPHSHPQSAILTPALPLNRRRRRRRRTRPRHYPTLHAPHDEQRARTARSPLPGSRKTYLPILATKTNTETHSLRHHPRQLLSSS